MTRPPRTNPRRMSQEVNRWNNPLILTSWDIQADPMGFCRAPHVYRRFLGSRRSHPVVWHLHFIVELGGLSTHQSGVVTAVLFLVWFVDRKGAMKLWTSGFYLAKRHFKTAYTLGTVSFFAKLNKCQTRKPRDQTRTLGSAVTCPHRWAPTEIFTTRAECAEQDEKAEISKPSRNLLKPEELNL